MNNIQWFLLIFVVMLVLGFWFERTKSARERRIKKNYRNRGIYQSTKKKK